MLFIKYFKNFSGNLLNFKADIFKIRIASDILLDRFEKRNRIKKITLLYETTQISTDCLDFIKAIYYHCL